MDLLLFNILLTICSALLKTVVSVILQVTQSLTLVAIKPNKYDDMILAEVMPISNYHSRLNITLLSNLTLMNQKDLLRIL